MRTPGLKARQPSRGRGEAAEGGRGCLPRRSWCVREYLADCHGQRGELSAFVPRPAGRVRPWMVRVQPLSVALLFFLILLRVP